MPIQRDPRSKLAFDSRPPQFRLRTLLLVVALCSVLFATMSAVGPIWSLILMLLLTLVMGHAAGNALGMRLRDEGSRLSDEDRPQSVPRGAGTPVSLSSSLSVPLRERRPLGQSPLVSIYFGAVLGALIGLLLLYGQWLPLRAADWMLGMASCAVLGGLAGFLGSGFFQVALWPAVVFFFRSGTGPKSGDAETGDRCVGGSVAQPRAAAVDAPAPPQAQCPGAAEPQSKTG